MRKYNLTALVAITLMSHAGYGMDLPDPSAPSPTAVAAVGGPGGDVTEPLSRDLRRDLSVLNINALDEMLNCTAENGEFISNASLVEQGLNILKNRKDRRFKMSTLKELDLYFMELTQAMYFSGNPITRQNFFTYQSLLEEYLKVHAHAPNEVLYGIVPETKDRCLMTKQKIETYVPGGDLYNSLAIVQDDFGPVPILFGPGDPALGLSYEKALGCFSDGAERRVVLKENGSLELLPGFFMKKVTEGEEQIILMAYSYGYDPRFPFRMSTILDFVPDPEMFRDEDLFREIEARTNGVFLNTEHRAFPNILAMSYVSIEESFETEPLQADDKRRELLEIAFRYFTEEAAKKEEFEALKEDPDFALLFEEPAAASKPKKGKPKAEKSKVKSTDPKKHKDKPVGVAVAAPEPVSVVEDADVSFEIDAGMTITTVLEEAAPVGVAESPTAVGVEEEEGAPVSPPVSRPRRAAAPKPMGEAGEEEFDSLQSKKQSVLDFAARLLSVAQEKKVFKASRFLKFIESSMKLSGLTSYITTKPTVAGSHMTWHIPGIGAIQIVRPHGRDAVPASAIAKLSENILGALEFGEDATKKVGKGKEHPKGKKKK